MDAKLRKHRYKLIYSGYAVIAFGVWTIIRMLLMKFFDPTGLEEIFGESDPVSDELVFILIIVLLVADLVFRMYIGISAVNEGRGDRKAVIYVLLTIIYTAFSLYSNALSLAGLFGGKFSTTSLAIAVVDLTTSVALIEIIVSSISIRRLMKLQPDGKGA